MNGMAHTSDLWTAPEIAKATAGTTEGNWLVSGVSIDSRVVENGDLFVAIRGPNRDGHAYVFDALAKGAAGAVVRAAEAVGLGSSVDKDRLVCVDDTQVALENLARAARERSHARIAAITGSVGKTSTKEALRRALGAQVDGRSRVCASEGNLNNHWGLPLSLARLPKEAAYGVFEMGMNHLGEISPLSRMARPHVAVITTVSDTHREFFESLDQIADAKAEIFDGLTPDGVAVLNANNPKLDRIVGAARAAGVNRVMTFGSLPDADCRLVDITLNAASSDITVEIEGRAFSYIMGVPGRHLAMNSLATLCALHALGADVEAGAAALANVQGLKGRGERHQVDMGEGTFELIDESYNASPASMAAAIEVLATSQPQPGGRKIAVLGDMLELGDQSEKLHAALVVPLVEGGIDLVFTAGLYMSLLWEALPANMRGGHVATAKKLVPMVSSSVQPGDVVMVKGSLGSCTRIVVNALLEPRRHDALAPCVVNGG